MARFKENSKKQGLLLQIDLSSQILPDTPEHVIDFLVEEKLDLYSKRMGIVEPVFANITYAKNLRRFNVRGKAQVNIIWLLYCIVHNIEKIYRYGGICNN